MNNYRTTAIVAGVLWIVATVAGLVSTMLLAPILGAPDYLARIAANEGQVLLAALSQFIAAAAIPAIAIAIYPLLRRHDEGLALGSVGFRLIEGAMYILVVVTLLLLVTLARESVVAVDATPEAFRVPAVLLMA